MILINWSHQMRRSEDIDIAVPPSKWTLHIMGCFKFSYIGRCRSDYTEWIFRFIIFSLIPPTPLIFCSFFIIHYCYLTTILLPRVSLSYCSVNTNTLSTVLKPLGCKPEIQSFCLDLSPAFLASENVPVHTLWFGPEIWTNWSTFFDIWFWWSFASSRITFTYV